MAKEKHDDLAKLLSAMADGQHQDDEAHHEEEPSHHPAPPPPAAPAPRTTAAPPRPAGAPPQSSENPSRPTAAPPRPTTPTPRPQEPLSRPPAPRPAAPLSAPLPSSTRPPAPAAPPADPVVRSRPSTPAPLDLSAETETATPAPADPNALPHDSSIDSQAAAEALAGGVDESDEVAIPAPAPDVFIHPARRPPPKAHLVQTLEFKRTIIPISLTIALICLILLGLGWSAGPTSTFHGIRQQPGMSLIILAVAVVMLGVGVLTMLQVRSDLDRQNREASRPRR